LGHFQAYQVISLWLQPLYPGAVLMCVGSAKKGPKHQRHTAHEEMEHIEKRGDDAQREVGPAVGAPFAAMVTNASQKGISQ